MRVLPAREIHLSLPARRRALTIRQHRALLGYLFIAPWLVGFVLLKLAPILASLVLSFTDFQLLRPMEAQFVGLRNYAMVLGDIQAGATLFATLSFAAIAVPAQILVALTLATLVNQPGLVGRSTLRSLFFIPTVVPGAAIVSVWLGFLDPNSGWLNQLLLKPLGLPAITPFGGPSGFLLLQITMLLWSIGPQFLIMLGALHSVPQEIYEAALVDGAGPMTRFVRITLPLISPAIFFSIVIGLITIFGGAALFDQGNPLSGSLSAFDTYLNNVMFLNSQFGYAASLAWVFFGCMLAITLGLFASARYWVFYMEEA